MSPVGFEPTISASEQRQTYALDCADPGTCHLVTSERIFYLKGLERCFNISKQGGRLRYRVFKNNVRITLTLSCGRETTVVEKQ